MLSRLRSLFSSTEQSSPPLQFKNGPDAFQFACSSLECELKARSMLPGLVVDAVGAFGADTSVVVRPDGTQMVAIQVVCKDGGFLVLAGTLSGNGPLLQPGDLVAWHAGQQMERSTAELTRDPRSQWVGIVVAKLRPEYTSGRGWGIAEPFRS